MNTARSRVTFIHLFPQGSKRDLNMSYFYVPRPPKEHLCLVPMRCFTPQPPDVYYQPPKQEWVYQPPSQRYVYQPPPEICEYQPPPQKYVYQPPPERYSPTQPGDARAYWELGIPAPRLRLPI